MDSSLISIHYSLIDDDVHKMDALSRNECEKQFLQAINCLQKYLGCKISIDVQVKKEGGVIDTYQVICAEILTNPSVTFAFGAVFNAFINNFFRPNIHSSEETKNNLENIEQTKQLIESGVITSENFESIFANDRYIKKRKSIFFKEAKKIPDIKQIAAESPQLQAPITIPVSNFSDYVITDIADTTTEIEEARIYIIAPILDKGRKDLWKGIYKGESVLFRMLDHNFRNQVAEGVFTFRNGTYIECNLEITKIEDDEKVDVKYCVMKVSKIGDDDNPKDVLVPLKKRRKNKSSYNEQKLF